MKSDAFAGGISAAAEDVDCASGNDDSRPCGNDGRIMSINAVGEFSAQTEDHFHMRMLVRFRVHGLCRIPSRNAGNPPKFELVGGDASVHVFVAVLAHDGNSIHNCEDVRM